jgi:hypothetical protein
MVAIEKSEASLNTERLSVGRPDDGDHRRTQQSLAPSLLQQVAALEHDGDRPRHIVVDLLHGLMAAWIKGLSEGLYGTRPRREPRQRTKHDAPP